MKMFAAQASQGPGMRARPEGRERGRFSLRPQVGHANHSLRCSGAFMNSQKFPTLSLRLNPVYDALPYRATQKMANRLLRFEPYLAPSMP